MGLRHLTTVILSAILLIAGVACSNQSKDMQSLNRHRQIWAEQGISSYRYQLKVGCFCPAEVTDAVVVEVQDGTSRSVSYAATGKQASSTYFDSYDTIEELFLVVQNALERRVDEILVTYDETRGFPTRIRIDSEKQALDDEIEYNISGFQALK